MTSETAGGSKDERERSAQGSGGIFAKFRAAFGKTPAEDGLAATIEKTESASGDQLPRTRREMIERVIAFDEKRVVDVMAPRADIVALDVSTPMQDLIEAFAEAGHSRMPVYRGDLDDPIGMAHIKDVVNLLANPMEAEGDAAPILKSILREILYVPPSMRIIDLLLRMQSSRIHMALVIDEFGGTDGLLTIEDLVEQIVGDINDEHDDDQEPMIVVRADGGWEADARVELEEFANFTGVNIDRDHDEEEVDTLGGLVFSLAGRVPQRGEVLSHPSGLDFEVKEADARKIRKILVRRRAVAADALANAAE
ncbi:MAG: hemolysin family protein [Pseudomonadota bacterium]